MTTTIRIGSLTAGMLAEGLPPTGRAVSLRDAGRLW